MYQLKGFSYEQYAKKHLLKQGLKHLASNYRTRLGEIDLIMRQNDTLVFVEVRYRRSADFGGAAASITQTKKQRVIRTAQQYLEEHQLWHLDVRFDVIAITGKQLDWLPAAFEITSN